MPGFWSTDAKDRIVGAFNVEMDSARRTAMWGEVQKLIYSDVAYIKLGDQGALRAHSPRLKFIQPGAWSFFWDAWVER